MQLSSSPAAGTRKHPTHAWAHPLKIGGSLPPGRLPGPFGRSRLWNVLTSSLAMAPPPACVELRLRRAPCRSTTTWCTSVRRDASTSYDSISVIADSQSITLVYSNKGAPASDPRFRVGAFSVSIADAIRCIAETYDFYRFVRRAFLRIHPFRY